MYSPVGIKPLSKAQLSKLLKGNPVRVMSGDGMKLHLSKPQHKKLASAHKKGSGMNLQLDPYQCQMHARGGGWDSDLLDALTSAGKKLLNLAPETAQAIGAPQLVAPINYLVDKYVADKTGEAEKSRKRAEEYRKEQSKPAPFVVDLPAVPRPKPAVPRRKRGGNIMEDFGEASQKFLQGAMRDTPDWLKGPEKDPLAFLYGGKTKRGRKKGGRLLIDEPVTARQVVGQVGDFVTNPLGTLGFGLKRSKKGGALADFIPKEVRDIGKKHVPAQVRELVKDLGFGLKQKTKRVMSDKQKEALAKGRAKLAEKRGGALTKPPSHARIRRGSALYPAGYKGSALMPAGY